MKSEQGEWRPVVGYEGLYEVSSLGEIRSMQYNGRQGDIRLIYQDTRRLGYKSVRLVNNGVTRRYQVHRIVAQAFIKNPYDLPIINHKDEDPSNNNVENLEWCTHSHNVNWGSRNRRVSETMTNGPTARKVLQYTLEGEFVREWPSTREIERVKGFGNSNICSCCNGKYRQAYGYIWRYSD